MHNSSDSPNAISAAPKIITDAVICQLHTHLLEPDLCFIPKSGTKLIKMTLDK